MNVKKAMFASLFAAGIVAAPSAAFARVYLDVDVAPPAPVVETVPAPRAGYVWAPGYYNYDGHHYGWQKGHWEHERHGQHWVQDRWVEHEGKYHHERGHWDHD
jgi:hypothetical protein